MYVRNDKSNTYVEIILFRIRKVYSFWYNTTLDNLEYMFLDFLTRAGPFSLRARIILAGVPRAGAM